MGWAEIRLGDYYPRICYNISIFLTSEKNCWEKPKEDTTATESRILDINDCTSCDNVRVKGGRWWVKGSVFSCNAGSGAKNFKNLYLSGILINFKF